MLFFFFFYTCNYNFLNSVVVAMLVCWWLRLLDGLRAGYRTPWADVAQSYGYSYQSHLIREVREFAGEAPTSLLRGVAHP